MTTNKLTQSIFRKVKKYDKYAQISNDLINDRSISFKALGIATYILSKPDDWQVYISDLIRDNDKEKSVRSGINELIEKKYMQRYRVYDAETKKVHHWETLISETPFEDEEIISVVREKYLKDDNGEIINKKITIGNFERIVPIVIEREVELLSQKGKIGINNDKKESKKLLSQNLQVAKLKVENEGQLILNTTNTNSTNTKISSSSSKTDEINLVKEFEENICELKKTTKPKFYKLAEENNSDMVLAVIEECANTSVASYKGFEVAFTSYLERNCKTKEDVIKAAAEYRIKKKVKRTYRKKSNDTGQYPKKFNNFEPRQYDYDSLEKKLLGWDE